MTTVADRLAQFPTLDDALANCPNRDEHTPQPRGYLEWHAWADRMRKTHRQKRCRGCGRYLIVVPK